MADNPLSLLGINKTSAKVYLSMLSLGNTTAQEISRKTAIKRPTVYVHLEQLIKEGLVTKIPLDKKVFFKAVEIETVNKRIESSYNDFKENLPELISITSRTQGKPKIQILEGELGIVSAYTEMANAKSLRIWSNLGRIHNLFGKYFTNIAESINRRGINCKEIITDSKESLRYAKLFSQIAGPTYSARVSPIEGIINDSVIYDDVVTLFRMQDYNMFVVKIEDPAIADTMRTLFELAWRSSKTIREHGKTKTF